MTGRIDSNARSITKKLQENKQQADEDAKKTSGAIEKLTQDIVTWKSILECFSCDIHELIKKFQSNSLELEEQYMKTDLM